MNFDRTKAERIWNTVQRVPPGRVAAYGLIADLAGLPGRARMVGRVMQLAPRQMHLPWHRILRSSGMIAFAIGSDQAREQIALLQQEDVVVLNHRVNMRQFAWQPDLGELMEMDY